MGNLIFSPAIEMASGLFKEWFNEGGLPCALVAVLELLVSIALSREKALYLNSGGTTSVMKLRTNLDVSADSLDYFSPSEIGL